MKLKALIFAAAAAVTTLSMTGNAEAAQKLAGTTTYNGHTYAVYEGNTTWTNAKKECAKMGGHLATITSKGEDDAIAKLLTAKNLQKCYFGLYKSGNNWKWVTGEKFKYSKWDYRQPDNTWGKEFYGGYFNDYNWNDFSVDANDVVGYVCEWDYSISVSGKPITLSKGDTMNLDYTVKGKAPKISFKSSNVKVAKVSSKGKIVAAGPGVCKIYVKGGNLSKSVKVIVEPGKVTGVKAINVNAKNVQLQWGKQATASGYKVYGYDKDLEEYVYVKTVSSGNKNSVVIDKISGASLKRNTKYKFKIRAFVKDGSKYYYGADSSVFTVTTKK